MFARVGVLSLVLSFFAHQGSCSIDLDTNSPDALKSTAKKLAGGIISFYNDSLKDFGAPGLFPDPYYFWEAGTVWNALVGYSHLTGDSQYDTLVSQALQFQLGDYNAYMPVNQTKSLGNDDQSCWGLAAMSAAEVGFSKPGNASWVDYATNVWNTQALRLDMEEKSGVCGGGLRWQIFSFNKGYDYKDSYSNGNFFLLSARLAKFTGNATYSQYADKVFKWARDVELVGDNFHVYAGTQTTSKCSNINRMQFTATQGLYTEGAALMYNITGAQNWTEAVNGLVNASTTFLSSKTSYIVVEKACENIEKCDTDMRAYKGVFARSIARAAVAAPIVSDTIQKILSRSAAAAASACTATTQMECSFAWANATVTGDSATAKDGNLGEIFNALEMVQGLLYPSAKALNTVNGTVSGKGNGNETGNGGKIEGYVEKGAGAMAAIPVSMMVALVGVATVVISL
ncbi:glycoside hydrolase [Ophiobolus disseminans]|uniref:Mannan endo-1,6-alpha-mannosidase n=1 Tax=Ophiobolus disseminans TaxID=1469910 RepID=A0A6A6ZMZ0_9PLEO|nr:glycoside hydrolase [Ophiobolus disseminans]